MDKREAKQIGVGDWLVVRHESWAKPFQVTGIDTDPAHGRAPLFLGHPDAPDGITYFLLRPYAAWCRPCGCGRQPNHAGRCTLCGSVLVDEREDT